MPTFRNEVSGAEHAIIGVADEGIGTHGTSRTSTGAGGVSDKGVGVHGVSTAGPGVRGDAEGGVGVFGASKTSTGTGGISDSGVGVHGISKTADGVFGVSDSGRGVVGVAQQAAAGVEGNSTSGAGVYGSSQTGIAVHGNGGRLAGLFEGDVHITRVLTVDVDVRLAGGDLAEQFEVVGELPAEPGCVVVLAGNDRVRVSDAPYDRRVAGVVSGAGSYRPALVLDSHVGADRRPLALTGKVWCNVDADFAPVELGDLLTTSPTPGYAMCAADPARAFGAVIGKALGTLRSGRGLVPVLVGLQ
jgi:hypothetical protein